MTPNATLMDMTRTLALMSCDSVLDFFRGDKDYQEVCKGFTPGFGTSCTFLPHWMLVQIGVSGQNWSKGVGGYKRTLINRNDITRGTKLTPGDGVASVANSPAFVDLRRNPKARPAMGDIVVIQSEPYKQSHEHVFVYLGTINDTTWDTGESGQAKSSAPNGALEAKRKRRSVSVADGRIVALASDGMPDRFVQGWLDLSKLDYV